MAKCPKCGNEINDGKRICPICGESQRAEARAAKKVRRWIFSCCFAVALVAAFLLGIFIFNKVMPAPSQPTVPTQSPTQPTQTQPATKPTVPPTEPTTVPTEPTTAPTEPTTAPTEPTSTPTEPPTESTKPTTEPSQPAPSEPVNDELIGSLYTRRQLMAMSNTGHGYGPGSASGGNRPPYPDPLQEKYGKYGANFVAPDNGNIYLTFDCGYEHTATDANGNKYRVTEKILDVLKEKDVKAVFFVTMYYVKDQPDLVRRMIDEGHTVGNHSNNHPVMPTLTIDKMVYEVMSLHDYVKETFGYEMTLFRFPTGEYSERSLAVLQSLGYKSVHWSFAYVDYDTESQPNRAKALEHITGSHHSGAIYLLHAISTTNASVLGDAIDFFRSEGYNLELFS